MQARGLSEHEWKANAGVFRSKLQKYEWKITAGSAKNQKNVKTSRAPELKSDLQTTGIPVSNKN